MSEAREYRDGKWNALRISFTFYLCRTWWNFGWFNRRFYWANISWFR